jgi:hypothetical protein
MDDKKALLLACLTLLLILVVNLIIKELFIHQKNQQATEAFTQIIQANSQALDGGGRFFTAEVDFDNLHFNLTEKTRLEDSSLTPLITVPVTTQQTSFLLVLAVKTRSKEFTSFAQSSSTNDRDLFSDHVHKVFTQRGICHVIIEIDHPESIQNNSNSWSQVLQRESSIHTSTKFGRVIVPTNLNIVSCQS